MRGQREKYRCPLILPLGTIVGPHPQCHSGGFPLPPAPAEKTRERGYVQAEKYRT